MPARQGPRAVIFRALGVTIAAIAIQFVMVTAYAWSAANTAPRHVPVVVSGPAEAVTALTGEIARDHPGAFRIIRVTSESAARQELRSRLAYGAIVLRAGGNPPQVLTASAASPAVAQVLTRVADQLSGVASPVRDVVPISSHDPQGAAFGATLLPVIITSIIAGVLLSLLIGPVPLRLAALVAFGLGGGAVTAGVAHGWLSVMAGSYLVAGSVAGLIALAISATVAGLGATAGRVGGPQRTTAGLGLGAAIFMLLGNPFSGAASAPELVPGAWGTFGQWLPPGAGATLLRSVGYFDGSRSGGSWTVLGSWAAIGLMLVAVSAAGGRHRTARPVHARHAAESLEVLNG
jgi:hypothetical protein